MLSYYLSFPHVLIDISKDKSEKEDLYQIYAHLHTSWKYNKEFGNISITLHTVVFLTWAILVIHCFTSCMLNIPFLFYLTSFTSLCRVNVHPKETPHIGLFQPQLIKS